MSTPLQLLTALLVAAAALLVAVLPAEYGIDPTGIGKRFGLTQLASSTAATAPALSHWLDAPELEARSRSIQAEQLTFQLGPFESVEYKYRLLAGEGLLYRWQSTGSVVVNFHSEPELAGQSSDQSGKSPNSVNAPEGDTAVSFNNGRADANSGTYVAPFNGIHGWFWQNRGAEPVTISLTSSGFFRAAIDYRGGFPFEKQLMPTPVTDTH